MSKEDNLSVADELLRDNEEFARNFTLGELSHRPKRTLAVLACMDCRIPLDDCLGLKPGDAHIIRNAGGIATADALRSLIISHHLLDTQEFIIINHTDCGMLKVKEYDLRWQLAEKTGAIASEPAHFYGFDDLETNLRQQIHRVKSHPWIPKHIPVRGLIYDVKTGRLAEVKVKN
jgi:carbonic anhydrase